jgi:protoporphyrinogen oxidase
MKVAVLGAGPAGLTAACILLANGSEVDVYESAPAVGGLAKTNKVLGEKVEFGAHFFRSHFFKTFKKWIPALEAVPYREFQRCSKILFDNTYFDYPPSPKDIIKNSSLKTLFVYGWSFLIKRDMKSKTVTADAASYLASKLGRQLYRKFFEPYIQKIWGCKGESIHQIFATGLLGNGIFSITDLLMRSFRKKDDDSSLNAIYPEGGFSAIWEKLEEEITSNGGNVYTSATLTSLHYDNSCFTVVSGRGAVGYDAFISTIPPLALLKILGGDQASPEKSSGYGLKFRNLVVVYIKAGLTGAFDSHCLYIYDEKKSLARITNLSSFISANVRQPIISLEYWVDDNDLIWHGSKEDIMNVVKRDIKDIGALSDVVFLETEVKKIKNAFLIPHLTMPAAVEQINDLFPSYPGLFITGRNASKNFNYSMEDAIKDGYSTAHEVLKQENINYVSKVEVE